MTEPSDSEFLFTSESVTEGHPDKIADQISDGVLDAVLADDPYGRVACETLVNTGLVVVSGEISTDTYVDIQEIARETVRRIGYDDASYGFDCNTCAVINAIDKQSPDIAQGVDAAYETRHDPADEDELDVAGAGDQGMMFGYATQRDRRADAAADRARPQARQAPVGGAQGRGAPVPAPRRQDAGDGSLRGRAARGDREDPDLHPARRRHRRGEPDQARPARARAAAGAPDGPLRREEARAQLPREPHRALRDRRADGRLRAHRAQDHRRHLRRHGPPRRRRVLRARTPPRSTARPPTRRAGSPRTSSPPDSPSARRCRSPTRSASPIRCP